MAVVSITTSVTVAKIKPTNFKPARSAIVVPLNFPSANNDRHKVQNALAGHSFHGRGRQLSVQHAARHPEKERDGYRMLHRGACHRARIGATGWPAAMTRAQCFRHRHPAAARTPSPEPKTPVRRAG